MRRPVLDLGWITGDGLARHLTALRESGFRFASLSRFLDASPSPDGREVVVAFGDEGPEFVEVAWPVLERFDVSPVLFVRTALVGRARRSPLHTAAISPSLGWSELRRLASQGASVQSAGHHGLDPVRVSAEMAFGDLIRSRRELENRIGEEPVALQYPFDHADEQARVLAEQAGFELGFAANVEPPWLDPLRLARLPVGTFTKRATLLRRLRRSSRAMQG